MLNYSYDQEPATERLMMINLPAAEHGGEFRHIEASVVRRAQPSHTDPDTGRNIYGDGKDADGYRRATWSSGKKSALFVEDFEVRCQMSIRELSGAPSEKRVYGSDYSYRGMYKVTSAEAKAMVHTFAKLEKSLSDLYNKFGGITDGDFAGLCQRVAFTLGINRFVVRRKHMKPSGSLENRTEFREFASADLSYYIDGMIDSCYPSQDAA